MKRRTSLVLGGLVVVGATAWAAGQSEPSTQVGIPQAGSATQNRDRMEQPLASTVKNLQQAASLTKLSGPGIVVELDDRPVSAQAKKSITYPGLVHDYELLQLVNELRAARAEGIALNGVRIGGYTAIRAKGSVIYVDGQAIKNPYRIEAIGNPVSLYKSLSMRHGLLDYFKTTGMRTKVTRVTELQIPAVTNPPSFRYGKPE